MRPPRRWRATAPKQTRAQQLRREQTEAEALLWEQLRGRRLDGHKFRRQHPLCGYIADFCCVEQRLIVELDGAAHDTDTQTTYDAERDAALKAAGYRTLRFRNDEVATDLPAVLAALRAVLIEG